MSDDPQYGTWTTTAPPSDLPLPKYTQGELKSYITLPTDPRIGAQKRKRERRARRRKLRLLAARAPKFSRITDA